jgi:hypothetical protein
LLAPRQLAVHILRQKWHARGHAFHNTVERRAVRFTSRQKTQVHDISFIRLERLV